MISTSDSQDQFDTARCEELIQRHNDLIAAHEAAIAQLNLVNKINRIVHDAAMDNNPMMKSHFADAMPFRLSINCSDLEFYFTKDTHHYVATPSKDSMKTFLTFRDMFLQIHSLNQRTQCVPLCDELKVFPTAHSDAESKVRFVLPDFFEWYDADLADLPAMELIDLS